jgi:hypothetical protein
MTRYSAFDLKNQYWHSWHSRCEPYTKTRELSTLERAADKQYEDDHKGICPHYQDEYFPLVPCESENIHGIM